MVIDFPLEFPFESFVCQQERAMTLKVYMAGPDVFLPNALELAKDKKAIMRAHGFEGLHPFDNEVNTVGLTPYQIGIKIFEANMEMMKSADLVIAHITPFRSPSADVGTAFEMGVMCTLGKPVYAYSNVTPAYIERVAALGGELRTNEHGRPVDCNGMSIEDFDMIDNLMLEGAWRRAGAKVVLVPTTETERFTSLAGFERQAANMARELLNRDYVFAPLPDLEQLPTALEAGQRRVAGLQP